MEDNKEIQNNHIPKVSIGMPVYNGEKFIRKALDSLLAQTFTDFELIISDWAQYGLLPLWGLHSLPWGHETPRSGAS